MSTHDTTILTCPFCGGDAALFIGEHTFDTAQVRCLACAAASATFDVDDCGEDEEGRNIAGALAAWNLRVQ